MDEFAKSFQNADAVFVTDIYAAREKDPGDINSLDLVKKISQYHKDVQYIDSCEKAARIVKSRSNKDDIVFTMGAGDIYKVGELLIKNETQP